MTVRRNGIRSALIGAAAAAAIWPAPRFAQQPGEVAGAAVETATFAGGCFWCMEPPFDKLDGVISTTSGYTGGHVANPTYEQVSAGGTGHAEAVEVQYDPGRIDYATLLDVYWHNVDPFDADGQFCDRGTQYRTAIFFHGEEQKRLALESRERLARSVFPGREIATEIVAAGAFYPAEDYHQNYYEKNPIRYRFYRFTCGRDGRLDEVWSGAGHAEGSAAQEH